MIDKWFKKEKPVFTGITRGLGGFGFGGGGGAAEIPSTPITASGGTKITSGSDIYHVFISDQNFEITSGNNTVELILVGGGGGSAGSYAGGGGTLCSVVRYGNVVGSRGSVVPLFAKQRATGKLTITNPDMTRFLITLQEGVDFVLNSLENMVGGELFVPKIPACSVSDIARVLAPDSTWETIGMRPGEKMHEILIPEDEARNVLEFDKHFVIQPIQAFWGNKIGILGGVSCSEGFRYASNCNCENLSDDELKDELQNLKREQLNLRFQRSSGQLEATSRVGEVRRDIARINTIMTERRLAAADAS